MIGQRSSLTPTKDFAQMAVPTAAASNGASRRNQSDASKRSFAFPFVLAGLVGLYLVYAVLERHEKISGAIKPSNMAINLRNIAVILVPVVLGLNVLKILGAKLVAWGVPGSRYFLQIVAGA